MGNKSAPNFAVRKLEVFAAVGTPKLSRLVPRRQPPRYSVPALRANNIPHASCRHQSVTLSMAPLIHQKLLERERPRLRFLTKPEHCPLKYAHRHLPRPLPSKPKASTIL